MQYFYTYKLPYKPDTKFDYWAVSDSDSVLNLAFSLYKTHEFYIDQTTKGMYLQAKGLPVKKVTAKLVQNTPDGNFKLRLVGEFGNTFDINLGFIGVNDAEEKAQEIIEYINNNSDELIEIERD